MHARSGRGSKAQIVFQLESQGCFHVEAGAFLHTRMCTYTMGKAHRYICTCTYVQTLSKKRCVYTSPPASIKRERERRMHTYLSLPVHIGINKYIYIYMCVCRYICRCVYVICNMYIYTENHTHTCVHACVHVQPNQISYPHTYANTSLVQRRDRQNYGVLLMNSGIPTVGNIYGHEEGVTS